MITSPIRSVISSAVRSAIVGDGALLPEWVPILQGTSTFYEQYTAFSPTGANSILEIVFYKQGDKLQTLAFGDTSAFVIELDASNVLTFNLISNVELDGVPATSGVTTIADGYHTLTGDLDSSADIKYFAANATPANFFATQVHRMRELDNYDTGRTEYPVNGRDVVVGDGLTQYGEIPAWSATNGVVEFDMEAIGDGSLRFSIDSRGNVGAGWRIGIDFVVGKFFVRDCVATADGEPVLDGVTDYDQGKIYKIKLTSMVMPAQGGDGIRILSSQSASAFGVGFIANLRLTDPDNPTNNRVYLLDDNMSLVDSNEPDFPELALNVPTTVDDPTPFSPVESVTGLDSSKTYLCKLTLSKYTSGSLKIDTDSVDSPWLSSVTEYSLLTTGTSVVSALTRDVGFSGEFKLSVKETTQGEWINAPDKETRLNKSIDINTVIRSKTEPTVTKLFNKADGNTEIGQIVNFAGYQPQLKGGGLNREPVPFKFEAFNGDFTSGDFIKGVRVGNLLTTTFTILESGGREGSYIPLEIPLNSIFVGGTGGITRSFSGSSNTSDVDILQGTDEQIQKGFEYPNVFRVLQDDGGVDTTSEYYYYNNGGSYPWFSGKPI